MKKLPLKYKALPASSLMQLADTSFQLGRLNSFFEHNNYSKIYESIFLLAEAKESSDIEGIYTCLDSLFLHLALDEKDEILDKVIGVRNALLKGKELNENGLEIDDEFINKIHFEIDKKSYAYRNKPGTTIVDPFSREVIFTPPQKESTILDLMHNLESYINEVDSISSALLKLPIIHYQFEYIHPYFDGNGRTGRALIILILLNKGIIKSPVLYLSRFINKTNEKYFDLLNQARSGSEGLSLFIRYFINVLFIASVETYNKILEMQSIIADAKKIILDKNKSVYSDELLVHIFVNLYTKNKMLCDDMKVSRNTATSILKSLCEIGILKCFKHGKEVIYKNNFIQQIIDLL